MENVLFMEANMVEKVLKGLLLAGIFGMIGYFLFHKVSTAAVLALIMFMSMFVKNN